jgi:hypothetical protein
MEKTMWDIITTVFTALAAIATAVMAYLTYQAIKESQGQRQETNDHFAQVREQDRKKHEDTFRPLLVLIPNGFEDKSDRTMIVSAKNGGLALVVSGLVRNIGVGPALNIRLSLRGDGRPDFGPSRQITPIAAGAEFSNRERHIEVDVIHAHGFTQTDAQILPGGLWTLILEYEDVFGNKFHTIHAKQKDVPWTSADPGPAPV